jgi:hypothetical protein
MYALQATLRNALARSRGSLAITARAGRGSLALGTALVLGSTLTVLATTNTPPTITSMNLSNSTVNEGGNLTVSGTLSDPDVMDAHSALIFWPDGDAQDD